MPGVPREMMQQMVAQKGVDWVIRVYIREAIRSGIGEDAVVDQAVGSLGLDPEEALRLTRANWSLAA